mgnify:CR=1 FL=1
MTPLLLLLSSLPALQLHASVGDAAPRPGWVYARVGTPVTLHAVLSGAQAMDYRWFRVEPAVGALDNTTPSFHFEPVRYEETELTACRGKPTCPAEVRPTLLPTVPQLAGAGTMAFKVTATLPGGAALSTPGLESTKWGGLTPEVLRVTFRADDTLVGYASELLNTPYIFGSAGPDGRNQSDLLIGSDCADFAIYARRRMGFRADYTSSYAIDRQAPEVKRGAPKQGDLVHFPSTRHVAILYEDVPPLGELNDEDLILHTCWAPPTVQRLADTPCAAKPWRLLRFPSAR